MAPDIISIWPREEGVLWVRVPEPNCIYFWFWESILFYILQDGSILFLMTADRMNKVNVQATSLLAVLALSTLCGFPANHAQPLCLTSFKSWSVMRFHISLTVCFLLWGNTLHFSQMIIHVTVNSPYLQKHPSTYTIHACANSDESLLLQN